MTATNLSPPAPRRLPFLLVLALFGLALGLLINVLDPFLYSEKVRLLAPPAQAALYLGLANSASVVGSIGGRLGGPLIDGVNQISGTMTLGYLVIYSIAAVFFVGSSVVVLRIPTHLKRPF